MAGAVHRVLLDRWGPWAKSARALIHRRRTAWCFLALLGAALLFLILPLAAIDQPPGTVRDRTTYSLLPPPALPTEPIAHLRARLPPSVWARAGRDVIPEPVSRAVADRISNLTRDAAMELCGQVLFSSLLRAVTVDDMGEQVFVKTGDIADMWTRDSAVQIGLYIGRINAKPSLRMIVEGAIRRQAFNTLQDPYANSYKQRWTDPTSIPFADQVIGRGGWVASRNYELDSGAYFFTQLYDYYVAPDLYRPEALLMETMIFDAVQLMLDTWVVEQNHDQDSPYRYFELPQGGKGARTSYTGMSWSGFRPSDDPCEYGYHIPSNIYAAAALERLIQLNSRIWQSDKIERKAAQLLQDVTAGINKFGIVHASDGSQVYAYEVDGLNGVLIDFDDANVPSLLSIPLLGWSGYNRDVYHNTRRRILSADTNRHYVQGKSLRGVGSPHTPAGYVWPMAFGIEALTATDDVANTIVFHIRQSLSSSCIKGAMHESVDADGGCDRGHTRDWFEWSNALFVVLIESALGERCDGAGAKHVAKWPTSRGGRVHKNRYNNDPRGPAFFQGLDSLIKHAN